MSLPKNYYRRSYLRVCAQYTRITPPLPQPHPSQYTGVPRLRSSKAQLIRLKLEHQGQNFKAKTLHARV